MTINRRLARLEQTVGVESTRACEKAADEIVAALAEAEAYAHGRPGVVGSPELFTAFTDRMLAVFADDPAAVGWLRDIRATAARHGRLVGDGDPAPEGTAPDAGAFVC